jgi:hypothetical protein
MATIDLGSRAAALFRVSLARPGEVRRQLTVGRRPAQSHNSDSHDCHRDANQDDAER